jgi:hypothetical protein
MWIIRAWQCISPEVTVKRCKNCCLFIAVDGTDGMLSNDSEEDGNVRSECDEDKCTECDKGDSDTVS